MRNINNHKTFRKSTPYYVCPICMEGIFFKLQKFAFFEFPNHNCYSTALCHGVKGEAIRPTALTWCEASM